MNRKMYDLTMDYGKRSGVEGMKEIFRIDVILDQVHEVQGAGAKIVMILFHGTFVCEWGKGTVMPGGVDTQVQRAGEDTVLSARYILEGQDETGNLFHIFVENNGVCKEGDLITTKPVIYTDMKALQWIEKEELTGIVESCGENAVQIKIYLSNT